MPCLTCKSLAGEISLSPGPVIYHGTFWQVEHVYPTKVTGWLVLILKRHAAALHELTADEFRELGLLQERIVRVLHQELQEEKEYLMCFAEGEGFQHMHLHVVAKTSNFPQEAKGPKVFSLLKVDRESSVSEEGIRAFCEQLKRRLESSA